MERERISLTIEKDILEKVDAFVDGIKIRNRSHAIETMLSKALEGNDITQAVILVGGEGTRLRPLTYEIPKPLIPVKGKPILEHLIKNLKKHGIEDIILAVGHLSDKLIAYFGHGDKWGISIRYVHENEKMGTAGPLKLAANMLKDRFIMLNGDVLSRLDIQDFSRFHKKHGGLATISLIAVADPTQYGVVQMQGDKVIGFVEKPKDPPSNLINAGVYALDKRVLEYIPDGFSMMERDVFPKLAQEGKLFGYVYSGQWFDVGTPERLEKAIKEWEA